VECGSSDNFSKNKQNGIIRKINFCEIFHKFFKFPAKKIDLFAEFPVKMASQVVKSTIVGTKVRPLLSTTKADARVRVLGLYKAWIRQATLIREY
jgi:hypothetical protein